MQFRFEEGEILQVNKPYRWTSFDVVGKTRNLIRKSTGNKKIKIGHAGTLDPLATGLLILCTGKFTKRIEEFQGLEKEYTGTFLVGSTTPSFDLETTVDFIFEGELPGEEQILKTAELFTGTFDQVPPVFSAIKVDGKRAYYSARKDVPLEISPRKITVSAFEITQIDLPEVSFRIACSKGTYIRALARDFGAALGCGAHLITLCRTRIGPYYLRDAYEMEALTTLIGNFDRGTAPERENP